jgi:hypothetical protein
MRKAKVVVKNDTVTADNVEIQSPYITINGKEAIDGCVTLYELVGFGLYCARNKAGEIRIDGMPTLMQSSSNAQDTECVYGTKIIMQRGLGSISSCLGLFVENAELEYE